MCFPMVAPYNQALWEAIAQQFEVRLVTSRLASRQEIRWADVVLIGDYARGIMPLNLLRACRSRPRVVLWFDEWVGSGPAKDWVKRWLIRGVDSMIVCGGPQMGRLASLLGPQWTTWPVQYAPYFAGVGPEYAPSHSYSRDFLFLGRLEREKGLDVLAQAMALVPELPITIAGTGSLEAWVAGAFRDYPNVRLKLQWIDEHERAQLLMSHGFLVLPSRFEAWGIVVNEALRAGLPAVVSNAVGSASELVLASGAGSIFNVGDHRSLAYALQQMQRLPDGELREQRRRGWEVAKLRTLEVQATALSRALTVYCES